VNKVGTERSKVKDALLALSGYSGVTGPFPIRTDREREGEEVEQLFMVDGKLVP